MRIPSEATVEELRRQYPVGTRVVLDDMDDPPGSAYRHRGHRPRSGRYRKRYGEMGQR